MVKCTSKKANPKPHHKSKKEIQRLNQIYIAVTSNEVDFVKKMTDHEVLETRFSDLNYNMLQLSIMHKAKDIVKYLMSEKKFEKLIISKDVNGDTAIHTAVFSNNFDEYVQLREKNPDQTFVEGQDPLSITKQNPEKFKGFLARVQEKFQDTNAGDLLKLLPQPSSDFTKTPKPSQYGLTFSIPENGTKKKDSTIKTDNKLSKGEVDIEMEKINEEECEDSPEIRPDKLNKVDHIRQVSNPDFNSFGLFAEIDEFAEEQGIKQIPKVLIPFQHCGLSDLNNTRTRKNSLAKAYED